MDLRSTLILLLVLLTAIDSTEVDVSSVIAGNPGDENNIGMAASNAGNVIVAQQHREHHTTKKHGYRRTTTTSATTTTKWLERDCPGYCDGYGDYHEPQSCWRSYCCVEDDHLTCCKDDDKALPPGTEGDYNCNTSSPPIFEPSTWTPAEMAIAGLSLCVISVTALGLLGMCIYKLYMRGRRRIRRRRRRERRRTQTQASRASLPLPEVCASVNLAYESDRASGEAGMVTAWCGVFQGFPPPYTDEAPPAYDAIWDTGVPVSTSTQLNPPLTSPTPTFTSLPNNLTSSAIQTPYSTTTTTTDNNASSLSEQPVQGDFEIQLAPYTNDRSSERSPTSSSEGNKIS